MLETLTDTVAATTEYIYCGDPVFNAIMGETERACREHKIDFQYDLEIPQKLKLDPVAVCSILSNLTRNAVAAAEMTERAEEFLTVKAAVKGDYLHICVENSRTQRKLPKRQKEKAMVWRSCVTWWNAITDRSISSRAKEASGWMLP